ncbi:MAG: T9SS type A sorting domain-containing protein [Bacteroidetes bacterium]|nr:T9SS type A sorting domain-containing protein [Bacteroidota bacterium]
MKTFFTNISFFVFFTLSLTQSQAADYYWVGGTGTWDDFANHWATTSGGTTFHASIPSDSDDVFFDMNSAQANDTIYFIVTQNYVHHFWMDPNLNDVFFDVLPPITYAEIIVSGNLHLGGNCNWVHNWISIIMSPASQSATIYAPLTTFATLAAYGPSTIDMLSNLNIYGYLQIEYSNMLFKTNDFDLVCGQIADGAAGVNRVIDLGKSTMQVGSDIMIPLIADSAHIIFKGMGLIGVPIEAKKLTIDTTAYTNGTILSPLKVDEMLIYGQFNSQTNDTIRKLSIFYSCNFDGSLVCDTLILANPYEFFHFNSAVVNNYMTTISSPGNQIYVGSNIPTTLLVNMDTVCLDFMDLENVTTLGSAVYYAGVFSNDEGGNSGWTFTSCSPTITDVWPGDVNNDLIVDNIDLLLIGSGNNFTGDIRDSVSILYIGHPSVDWTTTYANLVNMKHGDCNGDGVIFTDDTLAISQNYGLTHPAIHDDQNANRHSTTSSTQSLARENFPEFPQSGIGAPLSFDNIGSVLTPGASYALPIHYGTPGGIGDMLYGIAFSVNYDINQIDPSSVKLTYAPCWLADTSEMLRIERNDIALGKIAGVLTRYDQQDMVGSGEIAVLEFTVNPGASGNIQFDFSRTLALLSNQSQILLQTSPAVFSVVTGIDEPTTERYSISPNPSQGIINIRQSGKLSDATLRIFDTMGRLMDSETKINSSATTSLDLSHLTKGIYFLEIISEEGRETERVVLD